MGKAVSRYFNGIRWREFFFPFCFLDPTLGADFVREEIDRCNRQHGFRAIKLEVACNVANPATYPVFEYAGSLGFPVLVHASDLDHIGRREHQSDPDDVRAVAERYPGTRIIMAHLTGAGVRGVQAVEELTNVAIDTSGMQPVAGIVEYAVERLGEKRVIFGSDMNGRDLPVQIAQILGGSLPESTKRKLLYDNASEWLGITP